MRKSRNRTTSSPAPRWRFVVVTPGIARRPCARSAPPPATINGQTRLPPHRRTPRPAGIISGAAPGPRRTHRSQVRPQRQDRAAATPAPHAAPAASPRATASISRARSTSCWPRATPRSDRLRGRHLQAIRQVDVAHPADRKAVEAFYTARNYAPLWIKDGALTARAKAIDRAAEKRRRRRPRPRRLSGAGIRRLHRRRGAGAKADVTLTNSVLDLCAPSRSRPHRADARVG